MNFLSLIKQITLNPAAIGVLFIVIGTAWLFLPFDGFALFSLSVGLGFLAASTYQSWLAPIPELWRNKRAKKQKQKQKINQQKALINELGKADIDKLFEFIPSGRLNYFGFADTHDFARDMYQNGLLVNVAKMEKFWIVKINPDLFDDIWARYTFVCSELANQAIRSVGDNTEVNATLQMLNKGSDEPFEVNEEEWRVGMKVLKELASASLITIVHNGDEVILKPDPYIEYFENNGISVFDKVPGLDAMKEFSLKQKEKITG
ncbi:hypothetical protein ACP7H9_07795 [Idiomarina sp. ST20R2A10]|uniref:hypothetical protein n=1 Tax=Idiomarina sp. ST20R2A10 TaxID=3418369 RepID=UPI003EC4F0C8